MRAALSEGRPIVTAQGAGSADAHRRSRTGRWVVLAVASVVALNVVATALGSIGGNRAAPASSVFSTSPRGLAAFATLLERTGHHVTILRESPEDASLEPPATVVVLDPQSVTPRDIAALASFAAIGGRVVLGGQNPTWLGELASEHPVWSGTGPREFVSNEALGVDAAGLLIKTAGEGAWINPRAAEPVASAEEGPALAVQGGNVSGSAILLADASPLQNRLLDEADNAAWGSALAGPGRPVIFVESVHGFTAATGLAALPLRWKWALGLLVTAALCWIWAHARRLGPPEQMSRPLPPPRLAFVEAVAASLARTRQPAEAVAPVVAAARSSLARRAGADPAAGPEILREVALRNGLPQDEVDALTEPVGSTDEVLAAGRALARLSGSDA